jgi:hypothetical protein
MVVVPMPVNCDAQISRAKLRTIESNASCTSVRIQALLTLNALLA